jgi:hypothetical protein
MSPTKCILTFVVNILKPFLAIVHVILENVQLISLENNYEYASISFFKNNLTHLMDYMWARLMNIMTTLA